MRIAPKRLRAPLWRVTLYPRASSGEGHTGEGPEEESGVPSANGKGVFYGNGHKPPLEGGAGKLDKGERAEASLESLPQALERWLRVRSYGYEDDAKLLPYDAEFRKAIRDLESWKPDAHAALQRVYLSRSADPELPERWKEMARNNPHTDKGFKALMNLHHIVDARRFVLYRIHHDEQRRKERRDESLGSGSRRDTPNAYECAE